MVQPRISVIQLSYNQAPTLRPALNAILAQKGEPLEIVFSDDASTDGTFELIEEVVAAYKGPHQIVMNRNPENLGIVGNVNRAVALSHGQFIVQSNGDDISLPDRVARLAAVWRGAPDRVMMVFSAAERIDEVGAVLGPARATKLANVDAPLAEFIHVSAYIAGTCVGFSRKLYDHFGPIPDCAMVEDHVLPMRARALGHIGALPDILVQWRTGGISWAEPGTISHPSNVFYGRRVAVTLRVAANYQAHIIDLAKIDIADKDKIIRRCQRFVDRGAYLEKIVAMPAILAFFCLVPAYFITLWRNDRFYLKITGKYAFRRVLYPLALWRFNRKNRAKR